MRSGISELTIIDFGVGVKNDRKIAEWVIGLSRNQRSYNPEMGGRNTPKYAGMLERHHFEGSKAYYELKSKDHHDHLVCLRCGKIVEFFDPFIEQRQKEIAEQYGMQLSHHHFYMFGYCSDLDCRLKN